MHQKILYNRNRDIASFDGGENNVEEGNLLILSIEKVK
jgi:hypothetical protein